VKRTHGARNRHSDKEKFPRDLNRPENYEMSERVLKILRKSGDFQAEYEGSILFTRSSARKHIPPSSRQILENQKWPKPTSMLSFAPLVKNSTRP
jgi:hypothetical protein